MRYKFDKLTDTQQWMICNMPTDKITDIAGNKDYDGELEIVFTVNGVELDYLSLADSLDRSSEYMVKRGVKKFIPKSLLPRIRSLNDAIYELQEKVESIDIEDILKGDADES